MELHEYQRLANQTDQQPETSDFETGSRSILVPLLGMAGEVGELLGEHKKWLRDGDSYKLFPERVKEELGDLLWYLSNVATEVEPIIWTGSGRSYVRIPALLPVIRSPLPVNPSFH